VCGMLSSAVRTRWVGSWMKCFAGGCQLLLFLDRLTHVHDISVVGYLSSGRCEAQFKFKIHDAIVQGAAVHNAMQVR
jgi:hypothetical protein